MHPPLTRILSAALLALTLSLGLAYIHPFGNADLFAAPRSQPPQLPASIPPEARAVLSAHCADCHSSTARAPIYGHFAPISWLLERDIVQARSQLNLSAWDPYSSDQQQVLLAEIAHQARTGHMPPVQYRLIHRRARLTTADIAALTNWTHTASLAIDSVDSDPPGTPFVERSDMSGKENAGARSKRRLGGNVLANLASSGPYLSSLAPRNPLEPRTSSLEPSSLTTPDPIRGQSLFNPRCTGCHSLTQNGEGPRLGGVYGRVAATAPGFSYSAALTAAQLTWNDQTLDHWLTDPDAFVPGTHMDFRVPRPQERADLIAFLKQSAK
jgi:cytochrome c